MDTRYDGTRSMNDDNQQTIGQVDEAVGGGGSQLLRVEELIKTHLSRIDNLQAEVTKSREMLDGVLEGDETYREHDRLAKEAAKVRTKTKSELMKQPSVAGFAEKLKELKIQQKELKDGLGEYLSDYQRLSGANTIEIDGEVRQIIYVPKLVKKSTFRP